MKIAQPGVRKSCTSVSLNVYEHLEFEFTGIDSSPYQRKRGFIFSLLRVSDKIRREVLRKAKE